MRILVDIPLVTHDFHKDTDIFCKDFILQIYIFPMFITVDFPNYMPLYPVIDYMSWKGFILSHPKVSSRPKKVGVMGQFQVAFSVEVLHKCDQFLYVL